MASGPAWRRGGDERSFRGGARRAASGSRSRCHRSTEAPDALGAHPASSSARARVRHSPLPHSRPAPPRRTSGHDLDGQHDGPPADGTDRSEISVVRGGPQSCAAAPPGALASRAPAAPASLGSRHPSAPRGLRRHLPRVARRSPRLAPRHPCGGLNGVTAHRCASPASRPADPRLPAHPVTAPAAELPISSVVLPVRSRGGRPTWRAQGYLAGCPASRPLPPVPSGRVRPRPLTW